MRSFIREKKIYCGKDYMEVDIFPYTETQQEASKRKRGKRSKKEKVTAPKQRNLNDKNAQRYLVQLGNANFGEGDYLVTSTYKEKFLPETIEEAEKIARNYLDRINYRRKKEGLSPLKYIIITEGKTRKKDNKIIRIHHHIIINGGLDRNVLEDLWCRRKEKGQKKGERIGRVNCDWLQPYDDGSGIAALCKYLTKDPQGKKRWSTSQNLSKPEARPNDSKYKRRELERMAKNQNLVNREFWEKKYPGWTLVNNDYALEIDYNDRTGWSIYLKLRRLE